MKTPLHVIPPELDKNFMLAFESDDPAEVWCYNAAISEVLGFWEMQPFHQIGYDLMTPGFHGWEVWVKTDASLMNELLKEAEAEAQRLLKM